jgi:hypothetical protein
MESQLNQNQQNQDQNNNYKKISTAVDIFTEANIVKINVIIDKGLEELLQDVPKLARFGIESFVKGKIGAFEFFLAWKTFQEKLNEGLPPDEAYAAAVAGVIGGFIGGLAPLGVNIIVAPLLSQLGSEFGDDLWRLIKPYLFDNKPFNSDYANKTRRNVQEGSRRIDPLVIDLDGDGIKLVNINKSNAMFDLTGSGFANKTGWISSGDAFLVWDRNNDNRINDISEMFGSAN